MTIVVLNPNTSANTTRAMVAIARATAPDVTIEGMTAPFGAPMIATPCELDVAVHAVRVACDVLARRAIFGVIIAAFADPGLDDARARLSVPVVGIAEAGMKEAALSGSFAVVTTTPDLVDAIRNRAVAYGFGDQLVSVRVTPGDPTMLTSDAVRLLSALEQACREAIHDGAQAIVVGGGPLAAAARQLKTRIPVPIIEPVPSALARLLACGQHGRKQALA